jgi:hypothetical protein
LLEGLLSGLASHVGPGELDGRPVVEQARRIRGHGLRNNLDGLVLEVVLLDEVFRSNDSTGCR